MVENISYKIVKLEHELGRIHVNYKTDNAPEGLVYQLDLPVENNAVPSGDSLDAFIMQFAPVGQLTEMETALRWEADRKAAVAYVDFSELESVIAANNQIEQPTVYGAQSL